MSSHADTIRRFVRVNREHGKVNAFSYTALPLDSLDALLAENQQLREALEQIKKVPVADANGMKMWTIAEKALAAVGEE
jgi:hypothetical protein